jgi:hypothetical protein
MRTSYINMPVTTGEFDPIESPYANPQVIGGRDMLDYNIAAYSPHEHDKSYSQKKEAGEKPFDEAIDTITKKVKDFGPFILVGLGIWLLMR